jgi:NAD-dependent dihydropyrimidine dehydrogenase PreA subunit
MRRINDVRLLKYMHLVPSITPRGRWRGRAMWRVTLPPIPDKLKTVPGIWRIPDEEQRAFVENPLHDWSSIHGKAIEWYRRHSWEVFFLLAPRQMRTNRRMKRAGKGAVAVLRSGADPAVLKSEMLAKAERVGLSALGVAAFDEKYMYKEQSGSHVGDRILVGVLEERPEVAAKIPSAQAERGIMSVNLDLSLMCAEVAEWLHEKGFRATAYATPGPGISIHYAVEAGLGQLGVNGQLLTPAAGSRCRLALISTDAPLPFDHPIDYGIHGVCDECQVCVRRCPAGAIPVRRVDYRGIVKSKLNTARCFPVVVQTHGCAICMKVCPVQKYGLGPVLEEYTRSGKILGKDTDDLEGYEFEGHHYGPGERPRIQPSFFKPAGFDFDATRTAPSTGADRPAFLM